MFVRSSSAPHSFRHCSGCMAVQSDRYGMAILVGYKADRVAAPLLHINQIGKGRNAATLAYPLAARALACSHSLRRVNAGPLSYLGLQLSVCLVALPESTSSTPHWTQVVEVEGLDIST